MTQHEAFGFLQHLGLPTNYLDFSDDVVVASAFAVGHRTGSQAAKGKVCVLDVNHSISDGAGQLAEIWHHPWCERAKRQRAYAYAPIRFRDLKTREGRETTRSWWFEFDITEADIERFGPKSVELLDEMSDPCAGLLGVLINDYVRKLGPLREPVAHWLVARIPMTPLVVQAVSFDEQQSQVLRDVEFLAPKDHCTWEVEEEKRNDLRCWTTAVDPEHSSCFAHQTLSTEQNILRLRHLIEVKYSPGRSGSKALIQEL